VPPMRSLQAEDYGRDSIHQQAVRYCCLICKIVQANCTVLS
jgi:hypothetical protein